jgi:hypothetical protein
MRTYDALNLWLAAIPANVPSVPATFAHIEAILGRRLPPTARLKNQWWENNVEGHPQASAWLDAGFQTEEVNRRNGTVTFTRIA